MKNPEPFHDIGKMAAALDKFKSLLDEVCETITNEKQPEARMNMVANVIKIVFTNCELPPAMLYGVLECTKMDIHAAVYHDALERDAA